MICPIAAGVAVGVVGAPDGGSGGFDLQEQSTERPRTLNRNSKEVSLALTLQFVRFFFSEWPVFNGINLILRHNPRESVENIRVEKTSIGDTIQLWP
jgi:hypothetical protein